MPQYRRKADEVEAEQFTGEIPSILYDEHGEVGDLALGVSTDDDLYIYLKIYNYDGVQRADRGDWIIKRGDHSFDVYTDKVFTSLYEEVS